MPATLVAVPTEYCPSARMEAYFEDGKCTFCHTDHKLASKLTRSQRQVLRLLASGYTPKQIGAQLALNYNNLHSQMREARLICGAKTQEQLVAMLAREGSV